MLSVMTRQTLRKRSQLASKNDRVSRTLRYQTSSNDRELHTITPSIMLTTRIIQSVATKKGDR